jgi:hypothetical protein
MKAISRPDLQALSPEFVLGAPATRQDLDELRSWFGKPLPEQLVELLQVSNGIAFRNPYTPPEAPAEEHVHGCRNIIESTEILRRSLSEEGIEDLGDLKNYLFFASTWNGDLVGYLSGTGENTLVLIDHETGKAGALEPQDLFELLPELDPYADGRG